MQTKQSWVLQLFTSLVSYARKVLGSETGTSMTVSAECGAMLLHLKPFNPVVAVNTLFIEWQLCPLPFKYN